MAVVTDFTVDPVGSNLGLVPPSQQVQFTDLSTGSPDSWQWDFGDGNFSDQQHPLHTYTGVALDKFTVTLKSWIADTPTTIGGSKSKQTKIEPAVNPNSLCFSQYLARSWSINTPDVGAYMTIANGVPVSSYTTLGSRVTETMNFSALGTVDVAIVLEARTLTTDATLNRTISVFEKVMNYTFNGGNVATLAAAPLSAWSVIYDATIWAGQSGVAVEETPETETIINAVESAGQTGIITEHRFRILKATSADNHDIETKVDYVTFGVPPVAAFTGSPLVGPGSVIVDFLNQSTEAEGQPTTYSWKKRITGSGDAFQEFSTQEHPTETFGKT